MVATSTSTQSSITDLYDASITELHAACRGTYPGPSCSTKELVDLSQFTDGIDTGALRAETEKAAEFSLSGFFNDLLSKGADLFSEVAEGKITQFLHQLIDEFIQSDEEKQKLCEQADSAACAIDSVCGDSDKAIYEVLLALKQSISVLASFIRQLDPVTHCAEFYSAMRCGEDLINEAGQCVRETFIERNQAIEQCFQKFTNCANSTIEKPCPQPPAELTPIASSQSTQGGVVNTVINNIQNQTQGLSIHHAALGAVGIGVAAAGIGALISHGLSSSEWCAPEPPPAPEPQPEPGPESEPKEEPTPPSPSCPPTPDTNAVPEPPPPAAKVAHMGLASVAEPEVPDSNYVDTPVPAQTPAEGPKETIGGEEQSAGGAKTAGEW